MEGNPRVEATRSARLDQSRRRLEAAIATSPEAPGSDLRRVLLESLAAEVRAAEAALDAEVVLQCEALDALAVPEVWRWARPVVQCLFDGWGEDPEGACQWLRQPSPTLGRGRPIECLSDGMGVIEVAWVLVHVGLGPSREAAPAKRGQP